MTTTNSILFKEAPKPELRAGHYKLTAEASLKKDNANITDNETLGNGLAFDFYTRRFNLGKEDIAYISPPDNSIAQYANNTVARLVFNSAIYPYSRRPSLKDSSKQPFCFLLTLKESELLNPTFALPIQKMSLDKIAGSQGNFNSIQLNVSAADNDTEVLNTKTYSCFLPCYSLLENSTLKDNPEQHDKETSCLFLSKKVVEKFIPQQVSELDLLVFAQQKKNNENNSGDNLQSSSTVTSIFSPRVIKQIDENSQPEKYVCLLLSLEHCYKDDGAFNPPKDDGYQGFVVMKQWGFTQLPNGKANLVEELNRSTVSEISYQHEKYPHHLRNGKSTESYYTSPLMSLKHEVVIDKDIFDLQRVTSPDELLLVRDENNQQTMDITYASAWELGRLVAVKNRHFSSHLVKYKQAKYQSNENNNVSKSEFVKHKEVVTNSLNSYQFLEKIPLHYLMPNGVAPLESPSITLFKMDKVWLKQYLKGMCSIGDALILEDKLPKKSALTDFFTIDNIYGFWVRSRILDDYPELVIELLNSKTQFPLIAKKEVDSHTTCFFFKNTENALPDKINIYLPFTNFAFLFDVNDKIVDCHGLKTEKNFPTNVQFEDGRLNLNVISSSIKKILPQEDKVSGKHLGIQLMTNEKKHQILLT